MPSQEADFEYREFVTILLRLTKLRRAARLATRVRIKFWTKMQRASELIYWSFDWIVSFIYLSRAFSCLTDAAPIANDTVNCRGISPWLCRCWTVWRYWIIWCNSSTYVSEVVWKCSRVSVGLMIKSRSSPIHSRYMTCSFWSPQS